MPAIRRRPGKPTVYLDTSTLSYAMRGAPLGGEPQFAELFSLVSRVARDANLCVSTMHIGELALGRDDEVRAMFGWLDTIDVVWIHSLVTVGEREDENVLRSVLGQPAEPLDVFAPGLLSAFRDLKADSLAEALRQAMPLSAFGSAARELGPERVHEFMRTIQRRFHYDRQIDPMARAMTPAQKVATVDRKRRDALTEDGLAAWRRLQDTSGALFLAYDAHADPIGAFVERMMSTPTDAPSHFVTVEFETRFANVMGARKPGSRGAERLKSSLHDYGHLCVGAAYCDVFTCDETTATCLAGAPERLGHHAPIFYTGGDAAGFVSRLTEAIERAS